MSAAAARLKAKEPRGGPSKSKLTLSAYCRPEQAVRLTDAPPMHVIHTYYDLLDPSNCTTLGRGATSMVRLAYRRRDGRPVAVKTIAKHDALGLWSRTSRWVRGARSALASPRDPASEFWQHNRRSPRLDEVDVLLSLGDCPGVVQLLDVYETHHEVHLVMEYCAGGDLFDVIQRRQRLALETEGPEAEPLVRGSFTEAETATIAKRLLGVLASLASLNIAHRDIKPSNIFLPGGEDSAAGLGTVKLADFGLARPLGETPSTASADDDLLVKKRGRAYSRVGSDYYAAPEVHLGVGYDTPVDVYSLGITLFVLLCGAPPSSTSLFQSEDADLTDEDRSRVALSDESTQSSWCSGLEPFPVEQGISSAAQDLICKMIHPDPDKRITASEALRHEWIQNTVHEDMASTLSVYPKRDTVFPKTIPLVETKPLLRVGPAIATISLNNSPSLQTSMVRNYGQATAVNGNASTSLTLADVWHKLAPLAEDQRRRTQRRHRIRSHSRSVSLADVAARKRARNDDRDVQLKQTLTKKEVRLGNRLVCQSYVNQSSWATNQLGERVDARVPVLGPVWLRQSHRPTCSARSILHRCDCCV